LAINIDPLRIHEKRCLLFKPKIMMSLIAILSLTGCAHIPNYPSQLSPLTSADTKFEVCPDIGGRYSDKGISISPDGKELGEVSLTQILHEKYFNKALNFMNADTIEVIGPEHDAIEIQSWQGEKQVTTWKQARFDEWRRQGNYSDELGTKFYCQSGFFRLARSNTFDATYYAFGVSNDFLWARKAVDGSLSVYHRAGWAVFILLIPIWHIEHNEWYSFRPVEQSIQH
jgi:hypothetical protein